MRLAKLMLLAACLTIASCSADNATADNATAPNTTAENTTIANMTTANTTQAQHATPATIVRELYKQHDAQNSPFFQTNDRAAVDQYFTKTLADLIWQDAVNAQGAVSAIDVDPLYNAQRTKITDLKVKTDQVDGDQALVLVTFKNFGAKDSLIFNVERENGVWKISNITSGDYNLRNLFQSAKENSRGTSVTQADGFFEGTYQIGETTCTVKPIKMAFEVKWKQGTGTEIFFFKGKANDKRIFASDPETGKANIFSFDDEHYTTGTFYRGDGREFPIHKIK